MEVAYVYTKKRQEFGKHCDFEDIPAKVLETIPCTNEYESNYLKRNPCATKFDTNTQMSESDANTEKVVTKNSSMRHVEGGWPKDVDFMEQADVNRYRKKAEKDDEYKAAIKKLGPIVAACMHQNDTVDIYEEYFNDIEVDFSSNPPSAKGLAVLRDPTGVNRTITSINWHPDDTTKLAATYSVQKFQDPRMMNKDVQFPTQSYIWDILYPNAPLLTLVPLSPLCSLRYNPKSTDVLLGGCCNGLVTFFDIRKPGGISGTCSPYETSLVETSHHDPVYDAFWISSKTGTQCCSVSTDGWLFWWDSRKLSEPTDSIRLIADAKVDSTVLGGCSMEYNLEAGPTKYLVGTEQGTVLQINLRNKKQNNGISSFDNGVGKHHGPIYSIQRNPMQNKFFMTVGDWSVKVWSEDMKTPIMMTKYHSSYLTGGCFSPTRAGVFYVTRLDGVMDVWDYYYRQNEVTYSHKIGNVPLTTIAVQGKAQSGGKLVTVGDCEGNISLLEVCDSLCESQGFQEKAAIGAMLDRELKQEKNLEAIEREIRRGRMQEEEEQKREKQRQSGVPDEERMNEVLKKIDSDFFSLIKEEPSLDETNGISFSVESAVNEFFE